MFAEIRHFVGAALRRFYETGVSHPPESKILREAINRNVSAQRDNVEAASKACRAMDELVQQLSAKEAK